MFAIAFDLVVADTEKHHPKGVSQAYSDIADTLGRFGFRRIQGSVYVTDSENMANLFEAIMALKSFVSRIRARHPRVPHRPVVGFHADHEEELSVVGQTSAPHARRHLIRSNMLT